MGPSLASYWTITTCTSDRNPRTAKDRTPDSSMSESYIAAPTPRQHDTVSGAYRVRGVGNSPSTPATDRAENTHSETCAEDWYWDGGMRQCAAAARAAAAAAAWVKRHASSAPQPWVRQPASILARGRSWFVLRYMPYIRSQMRGYKECLRPALSYQHDSITISARVTSPAVLSNPPSSCPWPPAEYLLQ